ncbi:glycosyl transferase family group 2-domain-containing protein [Fusarium acuminatum]|uniref:Glycosyl transferase family group 2-domain-containing protein n=1 Tax=Fusarium acuminatum TaxID=5515 RepID=A0ABZ2X9L6_9HYPO
MGIGSYFKADVPPPMSVGPVPRRPSHRPSVSLHAPIEEKIPPAAVVELHSAAGPKFTAGPPSIAVSSKSGNSNLLDDIKHEVMVNYLYQQQCSQLWVGDGSGEIEGVLLRKSRGQYMACPPQLGQSPFAIACTALNVQCAMTVNSRVIKTFLQWSPDAVDVPLMNGLRVQILPTVNDLPRARKHQFAAFIASDGLLVVWDDDALNLMARAKIIESELMELVWNSGQAIDEDEKDSTTEVEYEIDEESGEIKPEARPVHLQNAVLVSLTLLIVMASLGAAWRQLAVEIAIDGDYKRLGLVALSPIQVFFSLFFAQVEERLQLLKRPADWSQADEALAYEQALKDVLEENGRAWADGNIRVGDYILLIDSDTRVPTDCLLDSVSEMEQSPEVGIMQFSSGVMQVVHTYFENGITFFTDLIYTAIRFTVSNGDVAPFVGHNAILRWSAIQQVAYQDEDGYDKFWSESHVSEDFDMSLRLQCSGYIIRLSAWAGDGFKEGVSLTVYDELARWEKYAFGCNELLFNPIRTWLWRGPFTPLFRRFLFSNIRFTSKITILSYIGTYYAIGAAWIMTTANYFLMGWFNGYLDKYYLDSWQVWFSIILVFNGLGNLALAIMRYRSGERTLGYALYENFKWTLMLALFLGGLSLHVSQALLAHMFEIDMSWGSTSKEAEFSNFFIEVPKVLKKFRVSMTLSLLAIVGLIIMATADFIPHDWQINDFVAILPMATVAGSHLLLPLALNPALMTFSW